MQNGGRFYSHTCQHMTSQRVTRFHLMDMTCCDNTSLLFNHFDQVNIADGKFIRMLKAKT